MLNALRASTLRPGLLVCLRTSVTGNCTYSRKDIELDHFTDHGERKAKWETERTAKDPEEQEEAERVRSKASALVRSACVESRAWLLCPQANIDELQRAIAEARELAAGFNATAKRTRVEIYVITGE